MRDKIQVYAWIGGMPEEAAAAARQRVAQSYKAIQMSEGAWNTHYLEPFSVVDIAVKFVGAVREAIGNGIGLGVDFLGHLHKGMAKAVARELE